MRASPSVGVALRHLLQHLPMVDRSAAPLLLLLLPPEGNAAVLGYSLVRHETPHARHIYDAVMAIGQRILVALCGDTFVPVCVQFPLGRPANVDAYRRMFHAPLSFDAELAGVVFAASWLAHPIAGADAARYGALWQAMQPTSHLGSLKAAEAPPFLVLHGTHDVLIPLAEARWFVEQLRARYPGEVVYAELPYAHHGWDVPHSPRADRTVEALQTSLTMDLVLAFVIMQVAHLKRHRPDAPPTAPPIAPPSAFPSVPVMVIRCACS